MAANGSGVVHKINNSYESEPSTGSGSSLSENNEGQISDEENILNLPYLLKPKAIASKSQIVLHDTNKTILQGSQESDFKGFGDSPYGKVNKQLYGSQLQNLKLPEPEQPTGSRKSPGKTVFPRFYDIVLEENSSNAVDLPLRNEQLAMDNNTVNSVPILSNLSFNGKIKSLTEERNSKDVDLTTNSANCDIQQNVRPSAPLDNSMNTSNQLTDSFMLKKYNNERSPDLFADSDGNEGDEDQSDKVMCIALEDVPEVLGESRYVDETLEQNIPTRYSLTGPTESSFVDENTLDTSTTQISGNDSRSHFLENCRRERELYRRISRCLQGVRPPPSVTSPDIDVLQTVVKMKENVLNFLKTATVPPVEDSGICATPCLFKPTHSLDEAQNMAWREVLGVRQHGLSYNLNKAAEQNEYLSLSVVDRYIGAETATSYVRSPSSAKKRNMRMKMLTQSPGNRLSHLAKRRAIFSSANLATNSLKLNSSIGPQILLDKKKVRNKRKATPKRKTPGSKKKTRKTPSSSARKRLYRNDLIKPGPSRETSKRALFQSPAKTQQLNKLLPPKPLIKPEIANRVEKSKRALFSPDNQTIASNNQLEQLLKRKRNDEEDADDLSSQSSKLFRANSSSGLTPRALKIKSQSFCIGAGSSTTSQQKAVLHAQQAVATATHTRLSLGLSGSSSNLTSTASGTPSGIKLHRAQSEMSASTHSTMTENQRKKLLWAVSQALQEKKISAKHEHFRQHAADLARIVKRIFQEFYLGQTSSNSETLLRLAKKYAYNVISGKNSDEIYVYARSQESDAKRQSSSRLSGYIGPEEFEQRKLLFSHSTNSLARSKLTGSAHNIFGSENSIDSFSLSQMSQVTSGYGDTQTQSSLVERISEELFNGGKTKKLSIQPNASLQNSSSKSNLGGLALRENMDCEQRRSAQKNFTGKDQRNISPYYSGSNNNSNSNGLSGNNSARKIQAKTTDSGAKAKRQISFDS
ncbi:uncharacterized protein LOC115633297 isoform X2 [Scaptodrosophila lebanonensis]|uniref:Uncharacterized protein LOC115633297 isoform X2 n=1 Tax=Drosophila lebanonensis TaxID=7225 RepID=A0A6J2UHE8_DROLE|nr:uncharacterized protein LOC115633297 isoform X2 [Scaptodrosophila lebanonensis]